MRGLAVLPLIVFGCGEPESDDGIPTLRVGGSETLMEAVNGLAQQHAKNKRSMRFRIVGGGSSDGLVP